MFYVYVLASEQTKWTYIGYTTNLNQRLKSHNSGKSTYTSHRGPWRLAYYEAYASEADARDREKTLKFYANTLGLLKKRIARSLKGVGASGSA